jgi:hypothetical protein
LPDEVAASLLSALQAPSLPLRPKALAAAVSEKVQGIQAAEIEKIVITMTSLYMARSNLGLSAPDFIDSIVESIEESLSQRADFTQDEREKFKQRLTSLLNIDSFAVVAKAQEILHEHQHALSQMRILTDIRPVFGRENVESPVATVVVHTMKITYIAEGKIREFFVAMDSSDIKMLKDVLERAEKKAESVREMIATTGIEIIESD